MRFRHVSAAYPFFGRRALSRFSGDGLSLRDVTMKHLPAPDALLRAWLNDPRAPAVISFLISGAFLGVAGWLIQRNLRHNEPGLRAPVALPFALVIAGTGLYGTRALPSP